MFKVKKNSDKTGPKVVSKLFFSLFLDSWTFNVIHLIIVNLVNLNFFCELQIKATQMKQDKLYFEDQVFFSWQLPIN